MRKALPLLLLMLGAFAVSGCDVADSESETGGTVRLSGQVLSTATNAPLRGVFVRVEPSGMLVEADSAGRFAAEIDVDSLMELTVTASKNGYGSATTRVLAVGGRAVEVPLLKLSPEAGGGEAVTSGRASNIQLLTPGGQEIGVRESGAREVTQLLFQVADSVGRPVVIGRAVDVRFTFGARPNGGEFIAPATARTDNAGKVTANLSSGTKAGVVQVVAEATVDGRVIRSLPVAVAIHGGHPHQGHFSIGPATTNFPGLLAFGLTNSISMLVGDRYSNPARPGSVVYFSTTGGVVIGSALTGADGKASVNLISGNPAPAGGIAVVTATTADENRAEVTGRTAVVFSGLTNVTVPTAPVALGSSFTITLDDFNRNPLVAGSTVSVTADGERVKMTGKASFTVPATVILDLETVMRGAGRTDFTFRVDANLADTSVKTPPVLRSLSVTVASPNGNLEFGIPVAGSGAAGTIQLRTQAARVEQTGDRVRVVRLPR